MTMSRLKIALMYGGCSNEHEVSLLSARSVLSAIDKEKYEVVALGGDKGGHWYQTDIETLLKHDEKSLVVELESSKQVELTKDFFHDIDAVFPVMHGPLYEDGCIQGLLELCEVAYVGSNVQASAVAMDKDLTKRLAKLEGVNVSEGICLHASMSDEKKEKAALNVVSQYGFPLFVKPSHTGSSVGVEKVKDNASLKKAIKQAFRFDEKVLVEKAVCGRELEIAVLETDQVYKASEVAGEIRMRDKSQFYSYDAKYLNAEDAELIFPAEIDKAVLKQLQESAVSIFKALELNDLARIDFFFCEESGELILNEVNTLPGFTSISMYPKLWVLSGLAYSDLISCLLDSAIKRHQRRAKLLREYE